MSIEQPSNERPSNESASNFDEEPWEAEIAGLLSGLPTIEPPPGFIASAVDHRPMFAGRTLLGLGLVAIVALVGALGVGAFDPDRVVPPIDSLQARHSAGVAVQALLDAEEAGVPPVSLPEEFEPTGSYEDDEFSISLYESTQGAVSVFAQDGQLDWSKMPADGVDQVGGRPTWTDPEGQVAVFESSDSTVTVIGLSETHLADLLDGLSASGGLLHQARQAASAISSELGFRPLD